MPFSTIIASRNEVTRSETRPGSTKSCPLARLEKWESKFDKAMQASEDAMTKVMRLQKELEEAQTEYSNAVYDVDHYSNEMEEIFDELMPIAVPIGDRYYRAIFDPQQEVFIVATKIMQLNKDCYHDYKRGNYFTSGELATFFCDELNASVEDVFERGPKPTR